MWRGKQKLMIVHQNLVFIRTLPLVSLSKDAGRIAEFEALSYWLIYSRLQKAEVKGWSLYCPIARIFYVCLRSVFCSILNLCMYLIPISWYTILCNDIFCGTFVKLSMWICKYAALTVSSSTLPLTSSKSCLTWFAWPKIRLAEPNQIEIFSNAIIIFIKSSGTCPNTALPQADMSSLPPVSCFLFLLSWTAGYRS